MIYQQSTSNVAAKRASSGELNRWRDSGVDPELLYVGLLPATDFQTQETVTTPPAVPERELSQLVAANALRHIVEVQL